MGKEEDKSRHTHGHGLPIPSPLLFNQNNPNNKIGVEIVESLVNGGDLGFQIQAARDMSTIIRSSSSPPILRSRFAAAGVIQPLLSLLSSLGDDARQASLIALLNLAVRSQRYEPEKIIIKPKTCAGPNKPVIASSGVAHLLIKILISGSIQGKVDAVTALYNLSTCPEASRAILDASAGSPLINLLRDSKKHSKFAEKTTALLEILSTTEEGRAAISDSWGGILTLVETVEGGSRTSMEHAVGALLTLYQSCRSKYRELILNEGAIPGLLRLTVEGTTNARERARMLLVLLRESPQKNRLDSSVLEELVYVIATKVDGGQNVPETAQSLLQDMMQRNVEIS